MIGLDPSRRDPLPLPLELPWPAALRLLAWRLGLLVSSAIFVYAFFAGLGHALHLRAQGNGLAALAVLGLTVAPYLILAIAFGRGVGRHLKEQ